MEDEIELIEIYRKGDKENEDKGRIIRIYGERSEKGGETQRSKPDLCHLWRDRRHLL